jgi:spore coat-associated protein N
MGMKNGFGSGQSKRKRVTLLVGWTLGVIGVIGMGAFAAFTSTASGSTAVSTGTMTLAVGTTGTSANRLSVAASNIAPGDTIQRAVDLVSGGNVTQTLSLTTTASPGNLLDSDTTNGLQMVVDSCPSSWTEAGGPAYTYTCGGSITTVVTTRPVIQAGLALSGAGITNPGTSHLRITETFPGAAGNTFQGLAADTITYTFNGTQRAGQAQ